MKDNITLPPTDKNIIRINRTHSYKVVDRAFACDIGRDFDLDSSNHNNYFIVEKELSNMEPRSIRENVFYLKNELNKTVVLVLSLQTVQNLLINNNNIEKQND